MGEYPRDSLTEYVRNAKKIINDVSCTLLSLNLLSFFNIKAHNNPPITPKTVLIMKRSKNELIIEKIDQKEKDELSKEKPFMIL